jgi:hypothetical protein
VARGARYPAWLLLAGGLVAVAAFTVLPPAGSTDALSYATFGRIAALGHNPYVMTTQLALYPASRLDYLVVGQMAAGTFALVPGGSTFAPPRGWLTTSWHAVLTAVTPAVLLAAVVGLVVLCVSGAWTIGRTRADLLSR